MFFAPPYVYMCCCLLFHVLILEEQARKSPFENGFVHMACEGERFICCVQGLNLELWQIRHHIYYPLSP